MASANLSDIDPLDRWRSIPPDAAETIWHAADGWPVRRIDWPPLCGANNNHRGAMLFLPGRGDHYEKYLETLDHFAHEGWRVTAIDWRGQGGSGRLLANPRIGHIDDFATWIADLSFFWKVWKEETSGPHVVLAHSMGGHLAMRALSEGVIDPKAIVMSAPMLGIQTGGLPLRLNHMAAKLLCRLGLSERMAWKESEKPLSALSLRDKILTHDARRYQDEAAWWALRPEIKMGPPSWNWVERAIASIRMMREPGRLEHIRTQVLLMATMADQLVSTPQILTDAKRLPQAGTLIFGKEAAHELLREEDSVRNICLAAISEFMERHAPPT